MSIAGSLQGVITAGDVSRAVCFRGLFVFEDCSRPRGVGNRECFIYGAHREAVFHTGGLPSGSRRCYGNRPLGRGRG